MKVSLKSLDREIVKLLVKIGTFAERRGVSIYLVGGAVRDAILKRKTGDIDVVTETDAIAFGRHLGRYLKCDFMAHRTFGTATIVMPDGLRIDVVTARAEEYARPGALPRVKKGDLRADAFRRDFTINSLSLALNPCRFGEVFDYTGGVSDLEAGKVRVMHDQSFRDDPTRIFRAVRYEQRYQFRIDRRTLRLMKEAIAENVFDSISLKRYQNEVNKVFREKDPVPAVRRLQRLQVFSHLHPELKIRYSFLNQLNLSADRRIFPGRWDCIDIATLFWLGFLGGNRSDVLEAVGQRVPFTKEQRKMIGLLPELSKGRAKLMQGHLRPSQAYQLLKGYPEEALCYLWEITRNFKGRSNIQRFIDSRDTRLWTTGEDLRRLGIQSGQRIGKILAWLHEEKLDRKLETRQEEMALVKAKISET